MQGHHQGHSVAACADLGRPSPDPQATPTGGIGLCMSPTPIMQSGEQGVATARSVPTIFAGFFAAASSTPPHISKTDHVGEPCFTHPLRSAPRPTRPLPTAWLPWSSPCQLLKFPNLCVWCVWVVVQGVRSCHGLVGCTELVATKSLAMTTLMPSSRLGSSPAPPPHLQGATAGLHPPALWCTQYGEQPRHLWVGVVCKGGWCGLGGCEWAAQGGCGVWPA